MLEGVCDVRWGDVEADAGELGVVARRRFAEPGVVLLGTTRRDRTPRISPVEPLFHANELWISMMWRSTKAQHKRFVRPVETATSVGEPQSIRDL
jgi:hypothetical protein